MNMHVTKEGMFIMTFVIIVVTALFCNALGVGTVNEVNGEGEVLEISPSSIWDVSGWLLSCLVFNFVESYGVFISTIVWVLCVISAMSLLLILGEWIADIGALFPWT